MTTASMTWASLLFIRSNNPWLKHSRESAAILYSGNRSFNKPAFTIPFTRWWVVLATVLLCTSAVANIPEPDHTVFGTIMVDGQVQSSGTLSLVLDDEVEPIASYVLGSSDVLGTLYALRIPMTMDPSRPAGTARAGLPGTLLLNGQLVSRFTVGEPGDVQRLDFDTDLVTRIPGLSIADAQVAEAAAGPQGATVAIGLHLAFGTDRDVLVDWHTVDGTALAGADYKADAGQVLIPACKTIPACVTSAAIEVTIYDDTLAEASPENHVEGEHFFVQLTNPVNAVLLDAVSTIKITDDDDTPPAFSINDISVVEPAEGTTNTAFTIRISHVWHEDVSVEVSDIKETAGANDFALDGGEVVIVAGKDSAQVQVEIFADALPEGDETFRVQLQNASTGFIADAEGTGRIYQSPRILFFVQSHLDEQQGLEHLAGAIDLVQSPDGAYVYVASTVDNALAVFKRDTNSGELTYRTSYYDDNGGLEDLAGLRALSISPDGRFLYGAGFEGVSVFTRDLDGGLLTLLEVEKNGVVDTQSGDPVEGLGGATALAMDPPIESPPEKTSAGGQYLYVAAFDDNAITVFERNAANGLLTFKQTIIDTDCVDGPIVNGLCGVSSLVVSTDGAQLYAAGLGDGTLAVFDRDSESGVLSLAEIHNGFIGAVAVAVANDGLSVYLAAQEEGTLVTFDRIENGRLLFRDRVDGDGNLLSLATDVAVSQDGRYVYASGFLQDTLLVFERAANGALSFREVEREGVSGVFGLNGAAGLLVSDDDRHVYAAGYLDGAVTVFRRELPKPTPDDGVIFSSGFE